MAEFTAKTVGFIGLGLMGTPMVQNLAKKLPAGTRIAIFDVEPRAVEDLVSSHPGRVFSKSSSQDVTEESEIILTMVPEGSHVRQVYLNPENGILAADVNNKTFVDCSTIDTETSLLVKDEIAKKSDSATFYDAPVSGGPAGAKAGTLTFMLGCAETDPHLPLLLYLLGLMGGKIFPCGGPSLGLTAKLSNNYLSGLCALATAEAMNIGMRAGLDPRVLSNIFSVSTAQNKMNDVFNPVPGVCPDAPASNGYKGGFKVQLMRKDFDLAVQTAKKVGAKLMLGEAGLETYTQAANDPRCRDLDSRVVYRWIGGNEDWEGK